MSLITREITVRKNGRKHGEVFTNRNVIEFTLDEVGYVSNKNLSSVRILEPSSGTGAFAKEILKRLYISSTIYKFSFLDALNTNVRFVELNDISFAELQEKVNNYLKTILSEKDVSNLAIFINNDFLLTEFDIDFDCIVGNPPYIRNELISSDKKSVYKTKFSTFKFRADLYILFYEHSLSYLKKGGKLSFICSNRWLFNQYGELLRTLISQNYHLDKLVNIEKTSPFDEQVIAYPCITTISNKNGLEHTLYYESVSKELNLDSLLYKKIKTPADGSWEALFLNFNFNSQYLSGLIEQGFSIGIGVATGADKIFILNKGELNGIEKSRLLPIVNTKDLTQSKIVWRKKYVINPFENGDLCNLSNYPHLKSYFNSHKEVLTKRYVSKKNPDKWYKTIDKIKPSLLSEPKLLIPDINGGKKIILDEGNFYPHHNLYYITGSDIDALKILGACLMSTFVDNQISQIGVCMNGGLARFQAQTLKRIKIPFLSSFGNEERKKLISAFDNKELNKIDLIINNYCNTNGIVETNNQGLVA